MSDLSFVPLATHPVRSATDLVFDTLYGAVISLKLPPGSKVSEVEIAKQMEVSRQPVRDAFFRLSKLGFLSIRPQRATLITRISGADVEHAVFVRVALEVECMRQAIAHLTDADIAVLRENLTAQKGALNDADPAAFHALDDAFHARICTIAGQTGVWRMIQEQKAHMDRIRFLSLSETRQARVLAEHNALMMAIEARDSAAAEKLLRAHIMDICDVIPAIRSAHPDYFEPSA